MTQLFLNLTFKFSTTVAVLRADLSRGVEPFSGKDTLLWKDRVSYQQEVL